jgi:site-specific DNA recombinase
MDRVRDLVAASGVSVVLAQDRDRFAREPAYHYLLKREFEEYGCKIRALNDRGDETPEGELTDGILDQLAKFERAKTAERTRRGKLRKAREGKVIAAKRPHYGYRYNNSRDGYVVFEEEMRVVARIFRMVGAEGYGIRGVKHAFEREGRPSPEGKAIWGQFFIRECIRDDIYKAHTREEIEELVAKGQMSAEVAARLDPDKCYGIWWFNRRRTTYSQVAVNGAGGKRYKRRAKITERPEAEWIAVPVPESGIPREWVDAARGAIKDNTKFSRNDSRSWELSGGIARCECGWAMSTNTVGSGNSPKKNHYYVCSRVRTLSPYGACSNRKSHRADRLEPMVWDYISSVMKDPETLRDDLDRMIELERRDTRGDPDKEVKLWADKLAEVDRRRTRYQEMAAGDLISFDELRARLAELEETRKTAERELAALRSRQEYLLDLERERDALLESLEATAPEALDSLSPEERHQFYKLLRLTVAVGADGTPEVSWAGAKASDSVCETATLSRPEAL